MFQQKLFHYVCIMLKVYDVLALFNTYKCIFPLCIPVHIHLDMFHLHDGSV